MSHNQAFIAVFEVNLHGVEYRAANIIYAVCRIYRIKSHCAEDIPCRHLTAILVSATAGRCCVVHLRHYLADKLLRLGGLSAIVVHIGNVVARFVSVYILTDKSGYVLQILAVGFAASREKFVEFCLECLVTAHQLDKTENVVRNIEGILPRIGLREVEINFFRVEILLPRTVLTRTHKAAALVENMLVSLTSNHIFAIGFIVALRFCKLGNAPVIEAVFEVFRHRLVLLVHRHKSVTGIIALAKFVGGSCRKHSLECKTFKIFELYAFEICINNWRNRVIANHTARVVRRKFPHWQPSALRVFGNESLDEIDSACLLRYGI